MSKRKSPPAIVASNAVANVAAAVPAKPVLLNGDVQYDPANRHTWLPLIGDPPGVPGTRTMWGVLRLKRYHDTSGDPTPNSAAAFVSGKLRPSPSPDPRAMTAARAEVLAPPGVDDGWAEPWLLGARLDIELGHDDNGATALFGYATITDPSVTSVTAYWEELRGCARDLVAAHQCAILAVLHVPGRAGSTNLVHGHLLIVPYRLKPGLGLSGRAPVFCGDRGRQVVIDAWFQRKRFR